MSTTVAIRDTAPRAALHVAGGLAAWLCGIATVAVASAMTVSLVRAGWQDIVSVFTGSSGEGIGSALGWSILLLGASLPVSVALSFCAGAAASDSALGGRIGTALNATLQAGPAIPSVVVGVAALAAVTSDPRLESWVLTNPIVAAAATLVILNLPIMTARFRSVLLAVPQKWRVAALSSGASPAAAFFAVVAPRATPGIVAVILNGAGQMLGETAAVAIVLSISGGLSLVNHVMTFAPAPLAVHLWQRLALGRPDASEMHAAASEALILLAAILALRFAARVLLRRRRAGGVAA